MYGYVGGDPVNGTDPSGMVTSLIPPHATFCFSETYGFGRKTTRQLDGPNEPSSKIDNNSPAMQVARGILKFVNNTVGVAQELGYSRSDGIEAAQFLVNTFDTVFYGVTGTIANGPGGTASAGGFVDLKNNVTGTFATAGASAGYDLSGGAFVGGINGSYRDLCCGFISGEVDFAIPGVPIGGGVVALAGFEGEICSMR